MVAPPPFRFVAATLTALCLSTTAWADSAGDAAVAAMDAAVNRAVTLVFDYQVDNQEPDKPLRVLAVKLQTNGASKLYEFTAPPDMQGTKVLILSPTQMYVYLPAFGKVRRIASHTHDQGFFGLAFSQDDLATTSYGVQYAGQIAAQTPAQYVLVLTAKDVPNAAYAKIEMTVAKDRMIPLQLKYFNAEGAKSRPKPVRTIAARALPARRAKSRWSTTSRAIGRAWFARAGSKMSRFPRTCSPFAIWGRDELPPRFLTHL
jgi:outer membrane lipoprotein-sorting protein